MNGPNESSIFHGSKITLPGPTAWVSPIQSYFRGASLTKFTASAGFSRDFCGALKVSDLCFCPIADVAGNLGAEHFQTTRQSALRMRSPRCITMVICVCPNLDLLGLRLVCFNCKLVVNMGQCGTEVASLWRCSLHKFRGGAQPLSGMVFAHHTPCWNKAAHNSFIIEFSFLYWKGGFEDGGCSYH